jgi:hypothetical protein
MNPLPLDFVPGERDVICGRGRNARDHPGNVAFRKFIEKEVERYVTADSKTDKSIIVLEIVKSVRAQSPGGGFVKRRENGQWFEVGMHDAREKVGQR